MALAKSSSPGVAVVRFHGRRAKTWEAKGIPMVERFRYLYSREELAEWLPSCGSGHLGLLRVQVHHIENR